MSSEKSQYLSSDKVNALLANENMCNNPLFHDTMNNDVRSALFEPNGYCVDPSIIISKDEDRERERQEEHDDIQSSQWCFPFYNAFKYCITTISNCRVYPMTQVSHIKKTKSFDNSLYLFQKM